MSLLLLQREVQPEKCLQQELRRKNPLQIRKERQLFCAVLRFLIFRLWTHLCRSTQAGCQAPPALRNAMRKSDTAHVVSTPTSISASSFFFNSRFDNCRSGSAAFFVAGFTSTGCTEGSECGACSSSSSSSSASSAACSTVSAACHTTSVEWWSDVPQPPPLQQLRPILSQQPRTLFEDVRCGFARRVANLTASSWHFRRSRHQRRPRRPRPPNSQR